MEYLDERRELSNFIAAVNAQGADAPFWGDFKLNNMGYVMNSSGLSEGTRESFFMNIGILNGIEVNEEGFCILEGQVSGENIYRGDDGELVVVSTKNEHFVLQALGVVFIKAVSYANYLASKKARRVKDLVK